jgi:hypothetical protein
MSERAACRPRPDLREPTDEAEEPVAPDLAVLSPLAAFLDDVESALSELREYARAAESQRQRDRS